MIYRIYTSNSAHYNIHEVSCYEDPLDLFAADLRAARIKRILTQRQLVDSLHMSVRTIIELERCKSSLRFETVVALAKELDISLDAVVFQDSKTGRLSKFV